MKKVLSTLLAALTVFGATAVMAAGNDQSLLPKDVKEKSSSGVNVASEKIGNIDEGGYVGFGEVDFTGVKSVRIKANINYMLSDNGEAFRLYIDDPISGECIGYIVISEPSEEPLYYGTNVDGVSGKHKLYLKQNYSHTKYLNVYELVLSEEAWDEERVTPVPDEKIVDNYSDTWTATNAHGLKIADYEETGPVKEGRREVGMFYHDWHVHNTEANIASEIIAAYPEAKSDAGHEAWPVSGPAWWNEPVYGFYTGLDYWHYRKAAELLSDAGVDVVLLDYTNGDSIYAKALSVMLRAYHDAREDGVDVPKISCYMSMGGTIENRWRMLKAVYFNLFYTEEYSDLWYYWDGKPLLIQTGWQDDYRAANQSDTEEMALATKLLNYFTFRQTGDRYGNNLSESGWWHWLVNYPQPAWDTTESGRVECMNLGMAINESYLWGPSVTGLFSEDYSKGKNYTEAFKEDYRPEAIHDANFFREQASRVLDTDPEFCLVTGWNEWHTDRSSNFNGITNAFLDLFDDEKSRDFEPTKGIIKDDYYNHLVDFIRKYKGVRPAPVASGETVIDISSGADAWASVAPEYINDYGAYERNALGYKKYKTNENYVYTTEIVNSISRSKVARDSENLYFRAVCEADVNLRDKNSLNLYINSDRNYATGWEGYDYLIASGKVYALDQNGAIKGDAVATAEHNVSGNAFTLKVSRAAIGYSGEFEFKWTDNIEPKGDLMLFYTEGNAAPVGRYNYLYTEKGQTALTESERAALKNTSILKAGSGKMIVSGGKMNVYDRDIRITPFESNGTLYIPMSTAEEILGYGQSKVYYDSSLNLIYLKRSRLVDGKVDSHWACNVYGGAEIRIDGKVGYTSNTATVANGIVYIPLTLIADCYGYSVQSLGDGAWAISDGAVPAEVASSVISHIN